MNSGLKEIVEEILTKFRRPPQVKSSKAQIHAKFHKIPVVNKQVIINLLIIAIIS
jgi:hypothetical protein